MESLRIETGEKIFEIEGDHGEVRGLFHFNPADIKSRRMVYDLVNAYPLKIQELKEKEKTCAEPIITDELVDYFKGEIDKLWPQPKDENGNEQSASKILFGNASTLQMFESFFSAIIPIYKAEGEKNIEKYVPIEETPKELAKKEMKKKK